MVADQPEAAIAEKLRKLKAIGVTLALDDFGTGYSNLQYLRDFPLDVLKIDRSFVNDLSKSESANSIALAVIALSRNLGMMVVAEGVATTEQREFLIANGCDLGQGYLFSEPMPFEQFRLWLRHCLEFQ